MFFYITGIFIWAVLVLCFIVAAVFMLLSLIIYFVSQLAIFIQGFQIKNADAAGKESNG